MLKEQARATWKAHGESTGEDVPTVVEGQAVHHRWVCLVPEVPNAQLGTQSPLDGTSHQDQE